MEGWPIFHSSSVPFFHSFHPLSSGSAQSSGMPLFFSCILPKKKEKIIDKSTQEGGTHGEESGSKGSGKGSGSGKEGSEETSEGRGKEEEVVPSLFCPRF